MSDTFKFVLFSVVPAVQDVFIVLLLIRGLILRKERKATGEVCLVSLSPVLLWAGALCAGMFSIPVTLSEIYSTGGAWCVFEVFVLVGIAMELAYCNETVIYDRSKFDAGNLFGIRHTYDYSEITGMARRGGDTILYCGRRRVRLDSISFGGDDFLSYANQMYFRRHMENIPVQIPGHDPMNGNLDTPWVYLFINLIMIAFSIFMIVFTYVQSTGPAEDRLLANAAEIRTTFSSCKQRRMRGGTLLLGAPGYDKPFTIPWLSGYEVPVPDPETFCSAEEYVLLVTVAEKEYRIWAVFSADRRPVLRTYDIKKACYNANQTARIIVQVFCVLFICYGLFGISIGRHPEHYTRRIRRLFYRDEAWTSSSRKKYIHHPKRRRR